MITVIKNGVIITMENEKVIKGDIVINDNIIQEITPLYKGQYDKIIDAKGNIVMPGLINAHTHLGMYNFRNTNDDLKLMDWLNNKIWPAEAKMTNEEIGAATYLSCLEMIKTGTTCCNDQYFGFRENFDAIVKSRIRCLYTRCLMDSDDQGDKRFQEFENIYCQEKDKNYLITFSVSPHSLYTCSHEYIKRCSTYAKKHQLPIHIHYMETKDELKMVPKGALKPLLNNKLILAHGIYIENIKELQNKDVSIVHNPLSNLALGCGIADIVKYKKANLNVCIGTDGIGSGYSLNLFKHLPFVYLLPKGMYQDPSIITAFEVLKMGTVNGAKALGINNLGLIKKGYKADLIIVKLLDKPINNYFVALLTNNSEVLTTIVNGKVLMLNKKLKV